MQHVKALWSTIFFYFIFLSFIYFFFFISIYFHRRKNILSPSPYLQSLTRMLHHRFPNIRSRNRNAEMVCTGTYIRVTRACTGFWFLFLLSFETLVESIVLLQQTLTKRNVSRSLHRIRADLGKMIFYVI